MRYQILVFLMAFTSFSCCNEPLKKTIVPLIPGASITICLNNNHDFSSHNSNMSSPAQSVKVQAPQESPVLHKLATLWQENTIKETLQKNSSHFLYHYKWHILALITAGAYAGLVYIITSGNRYLADAQLWSSWHQELPLDQLLAIPQQQLSQDLLREIQRRYTDPESITNFMKPLGKFMMAIEQEEELLKWYQNAYSWISYARLPQLVPLNKQRFGKINERLQRLAYYKNIFQSWAAEYQLEVAKRMWYRSASLKNADFQEVADSLCRESAATLLNYWDTTRPAIPAFT